MTPAACLKTSDRYYDTVPTFPPIVLGTRERREWLGNQSAKGLICRGFPFPWVSGTVRPKSLKYMTFRFLVVVIERGGSGPSLSLILTNQRNFENANCANRPQLHLSARSAASRFAASAAAMGRGGPMAGVASSRRKSPAAGSTRSSRAPLVRTSRTDLSRGRFIASRFRFWGAAVSRSASPRTPTYIGGYSHD